MTYRTLIFSLILLVALFIGCATPPPQDSRAAAVVYVDADGRLQYDGAFVTPQTLGGLSRKGKFSKVTLTAAGEVSPEQLSRSRSAIVAQGISNVVIVGARKFVLASNEPPSVISR